MRYLADKMLGDFNACARTVHDKSETLLTTDSVYIALICNLRPKERILRADNSNSQITKNINTYRHPNSENLVGKK
jgi:hypothetical protein